MDDPLSHALGQKSDRPCEPTTAHEIQSLTSVIPDLHDQIIDVLRLPFFDGGIDDEAVPIMSHTLMQTGSIRVTAHRREPAYEVKINVDARTVENAADGPARYELTCLGHIIHSEHDRSEQREFPVPVTILRDGMFRLDADKLKAEMAAHIRHFEA